MSRAESPRCLHFADRISCPLVAAYYIAAACVCSLLFAVGCPKGVSETTQAALATGLVCENGIWNVGEIDTTGGQAISHVFSLRNRSTEAIVIKDIRSSCGCMVVGGFKKMLAPDGNSDIHVSLTVPPVPGGIQKELLVDTEKPEYRIVLRIVGSQKINSSLCSFPESLDFGIVAQGKSKTRTIRIARYDKSAVQLRDVRFADDHLSLSCAPCKQQNGRTEITVRLDTSSLPTGDYQSKVLISCSHPLFGDLAVPVRAKVKR